MGVGGTEPGAFSFESHEFSLTEGGIARAMELRTAS